MSPLQTSIYYTIYMCVYSGTLPTRINIYMYEYHNNSMVMYTYRYA